ncbi:Ger(x)C family spore germination protein [Caproiciproducens faecalis]|uniref:Ger(X)C family spore germination protein n=1 Tax=Caproiciproducens faecalis TaxID=2820301 RepID=A0ABS7DRA5_9FIRM|nr:Ger(x)C family spore germination protein [Caproiciproducens faecalis]MBW7573838.1 Ger(x)C family spore germination protein [Caproiciproducens faecalis]
MNKKIVCLLLSLILLLSQTGCWSYRGLNEITIIAGIGIDLDPKTKDYLVSCEIIDLTSTGKESGTKAKLVESRGKTVMDAVRNAKKRLLNKLYWGNNEVLIFGNELAKSGDIGNVINWFLTDAECRETVCLVVSQEKTAKDLLSIYGLDNSVVAFEIKKIIADDENVVGTMENVQLFQAFSILNSPGRSLALPAFRDVKNDEDIVAESNGEAVFKGDKLVGYLPPEESKYYLFAVDEIHGGILTTSSTDEDQTDVSLEISKSKTKNSYSYENGQLKFTIKIETEVAVDEMKPGVDLLDEDTLEKIEQREQKMIEERTESVIKKVQTQYNSDIFGFGNMIYKSDVKLWQQLEPEWDKIFPTIQVKVESKVNIVNTSFLKHS